MQTAAVSSVVWELLFVVLLWKRDRSIYWAKSVQSVNMYIKIASFQTNVYFFSFVL